VASACATDVLEIFLHGEAVEGFGPQLVEFLVACPAAGRAGEPLGPGREFVLVAEECCTASGERHDDEGRRGCAACARLRAQRSTFISAYFPNAPLVTRITSPPVLGSLLFRRRCRRGGRRNPSGGAGAEKAPPSGFECGRLESCSPQVAARRGGRDARSPGPHHPPLTCQHSYYSLLGYVFRDAPSTNSAVSLTLPATSGTEKPKMTEKGTTRPRIAVLLPLVQVKKRGSVPVPSPRTTALRRRLQATADSDR
jgi:hypothetical protein